MSDFASLMRWADTLRRLDSDPIRSNWWVGYIRGLCRAYHGDQFGTRTEHKLWLSAVESSDPQRAVKGEGYRAGLTLIMRDPEGRAKKRGRGI